MLVKPAPGLALRDPATKMPVPAEGLDVPDTSPLWARMIADGDVVEIKSAPAKPTKEGAAQ